MTETGLDRFRVVLVRPAHAGNVGAVCRAMMNMGLSDLAIAEPRGPLDEEEARRRAYRAVDILEKSRTFTALAEAVADCSLVAGTSARTGLYRAHARTPREWAPDLVRAARQGRVALVFGPEDNGLTRDQLALCSRIIQIPSSDAYPSLNLSHAVMVCCYEVFLAADACERLVSEASPEAATALRERMFALWREALLTIGFMDRQKEEHMMLGWRRILSRGLLTEADIKILMGIARQALWCARQNPAGEGAAREPETTTPPKH